MSVELNTVVQEVVIDDSKSAQGAARVIGSMEKMAAAADRVTAANQRQASGFDALDAALKSSTPAQESALRRLDSWRARADPVEASLQQLARAERDWNRAITQGLADEQQKVQNLDQLWKKMLGAAEAQEKLNAAMRAQEAQTSFNAQLGVRDNFDTAKRATDIAAYGQELDRLQQKYAPLAAAQALYEHQIEEINQAQRVGALTAEEAAAALAMNEGGYKRSVTAIQASQQSVMGHTGAVKLQSWQVANLGQQLQDVFVQMQMGANPFTILAQQGPQITTAMGGVRNALSLVMDWIKPVYVGLGLLAGAVALVSTRAVSLQSDARTMSVSFRAWGKDVEITTDQVKAYVDELRDYGISQSDAVEAAQAAIAASGSTAADLTRRAAADAADFSAAYGTSIDEAAKKLVELRTQGYPAIRSLDEAYRFLTDAQAKHVRELVESGRQAEAMDVAYAVLQSRIKGLADDAMSPLGRAITSTKRAWADLLDTAAGSDVVVGFVESLGGGFRAIADILRGDLTDAWDAWVQHVVNDPAITIIEKMLDYKPGVDRLLANTPGSEDYVAARSDLGSAYSGTFSQFTASIGGSSSNPKLRNEIDERVAAYDREIEIMGRSAATRDAYRVKLETEIEWRKRGADETQVQVLAERAYQAALARSVVAVNDNISAMSQQSEQLIMVAAAYEISTAAGKDAELRMQAYLATTAKGVAGEEAYYQALRKVTDQQRAASEAQSLASERLQSYIAVEDARIARIIDPAVRHHEELRLNRQAKINELIREYGSLTEQAMKHLSEFDVQQAAADQKRFWEDVRGKAEEISGDITDFLVDGFVNAAEGGKSTFEDMWDGALAGAKRFLANLAAEFLKQEFILPIVTQVVGTNSSLLGIVAPGSGTGGNLGGISGIGNIGSIGGLLGDAWSAVSGIFGGGAATSGALSGFNIAGTAGLGTAGGLPAYNAAGLSGTGGLSAAMSAIPVWGWIAAAASLLKGFTEGEDPGSPLGVLDTLLAPSLDQWQAAPRRSIANAMDPLGLALTDLGLPSFLSLGGIVSSILGTDQKPSNKFAYAGIDITEGEVGDPIFAAHERSQATIDASQKMAATFLEIAQAIEAVTGGTGAQEAFVVAGERDGFRAGVGTTAMAEGRGFRTAEEAIDYMVTEFAKSLTGVENENMQKALAAGGTGEEILSNLNFVQQLNALTDDGSMALVNALKGINDQFDALAEQAIELGIATGDLEAARVKELNATRGQFEATITGLEDATRSTAQQYFAQTLDPLTQFRDSVLRQGALSNMSNRDQYLYSQDLFRSLDLNTASASDIVSLGQTYLTQARDYGASGSAFTDAFREVNSVVSQLISDREKQKSDIEAMGISLSVTMVDQTDRLVKVVEQAVAELERLRKAQSKAA